MSNDLDIFPISYFLALKINIVQRAPERGSWKHYTRCSWIGKFAQDFTARKLGFFVPAVTNAVRKGWSRGGSTCLKIPCPSRPPWDCHPLLTFLLPLNTQSLPTTQRFAFSISQNLLQTCGTVVPSPAKCTDTPTSARWAPGDHCLDTG